MIWAVLILMVMVALLGASAWHVSRRQLAATTAAQQWRLARQVFVVSAGIGILVAGAVAFVLTGYDW